VSRVLPSPDEVRLSTKTSKCPGLQQMSVRGGLEPISYVLEPFDEVSPWLDVD
jgi:hypothetical protein